MVVASGLDEANTASDEALGKRGEIEERILNMSAVSFAGIAVKLRVMRRLAFEEQRSAATSDDNLDWQYKFGVSALRDAELCERDGGEYRPFRP